jgi:hypothetical protein
MATLSDFVLKLSREPQAFDAFKRDQQAYLNSSDLSDEDKAVLASGDPMRIREAISAQAPSSPSAAHDYVIVLVAVTVTTKTTLTEEA